MSRLILPGDKGFDVAFHYPSAASALAQGYTFMVGYDSSNPAKNLPRAKAQEYIDAGMGVWIVHEETGTRTNLGGTAGTADGTAHKKRMDPYGYPQDIASLVANDTDTTNFNLGLETIYHRNFGIAINKTKGLYGDIDIAATTGWDLGWLPNAWSWDHPNPRLKTVAIQAAKAMGFHMVQGRLSDDVNEPSYDVIDGINVDINWCIRECYAWGNPRPTKEIPMTPYIFRLATGEVGIRHESGSRSVNDGELQGPFSNEVVHDVPAGSNWETWIKMELAKYGHDLIQPTGPVFPTKITLSGGLS